MAKKLSEIPNTCKSCWFLSEEGECDRTFCVKVESLEDELSNLRITKLHNDNYIERLQAENRSLKEQIDFIDKLVKDKDLMLNDLRSRLNEAEKLIKDEYYSQNAIIESANIKDYERCTCFEEYIGIFIKRLEKTLRGEK